VPLNSTSVFLAVFDSRNLSQLDSILNISRAVFVCLMLGAGYLFFARYANKEIIGPVKRMIEKLQRIASNPLEAVSTEDKEALVKEEMNKDLVTVKAQ